MNVTKGLEVYAESNFGTTVCIRAKVEEAERLEDAIIQAMKKANSFSVGDEKFTITSIRSVELLKKRTL